MGSARKRPKKYDRIRDDKMKGHTKHNQNQPTKILEEDQIKRMKVMKRKKLVVLLIETNQKAQKI